MQRHVHLIVRRLIVRVMAKIALLLTLVVTRHRVVILLIVANVALLRGKIAPHVLVLTVLLSMIVQIVRIGVRVRSAARVIVIRVQPGAAMIAARRVVNILTQHQRSVANSRRVLSAPIVPVMTTCRFSAQPAWMPHRVVHAPSSRMTTALSAVATSPQAQR